MAEVEDVHVIDLDYERERPATVKSSTLNLTNTILGAGILGLPYVFRETGLILGLLVVAGSACLAVHGLQILCRCGQEVDIPSYAAIANRTVPRLTKVIDLGVVALTFGVCCAYLFIIGDLMPLAYRHFSTDHGTLAGRNFWIVAAMCVVIPLALLPKMDALKFTSFCSLATVTTIGLIVTGYAYSYNWGNSLPASYTQGDKFLHGCGDGNSLGEIRLFHLSPKLIFVLPMVLFAFCCHPNIFLIVEEIQNPTYDRLNTVVTSCITISGCVYTTVGVFGYLTFYNQTCDNILTNYDENSIATTITRVALSTVCLFHYPMVLFPCRKCVDTMIFGEGKRPYSIQAMEVLAIGFATFVTALSVSSLGFMFSIMGSVGASCTAFVVPGLYSFYLLGPGKSPDNKGLFGHGFRSDVGLFCFGCLMLVAAPYIALSG